MAVKTKPVKLPEISLKLVRSSRGSYEPVVIRIPDDVTKFLMWMKQEPEEHFVSVHLNAKHEVIGLHKVSKGTVSASLVHPREVFKAALLANSHAIIVAHNHPTGDPSPSPEDIEVTKQLIEAGKILGVKVLDHLIIGDDTYSIREHEFKHSCDW